MTTGYVNAVDEMLACLKTSLDAGAAAIVGYAPQVVWPDIEPPTSPDMSKFWLRVSLQMVSEGDAGIGADEQGNMRRYSSAGLLFVQCFGPMAGDALVADKLRQLAVLCRNAFRGVTTPSQVWFRNARVQPLPPQDKFYRYNAVTEFQYMEIG